MSAKANIVVYLDDATTQKTLKPYSSQDGSERWIDSDSALPGVLKVKAEMGRQLTKEKIERRMFKVEFPIAGTTTTLVNGVLVNTPTAAYTIPAYIVMAVPPQASDSDCADAFKLLMHALLGAEAAGTANLYETSVVQAQDFMIHGFLPS